MTWTTLAADDAAATWDAQLLRFDDHSLYQSRRWGRYKQARGWTPQYLRAESDGQVIGMVQALVRTYPLGTVVAWCPGGPVGCLRACARESMARLGETLHARRFYCRSSFARVRTNDDVEYLRANGWHEPDCPVGARATAIWNLEKSEEQLLAGLNRNWRYSLRQALQRNLSIDRLDPPPVREIADLCRDMHAAKGIQAPVRDAEVAALFDELGDQVLVYGCRDDAGRLVAFHSCAVLGHRGWELLAATSADARRSGASFAVLWTMVLACRRRGVTHFDLAGLDSVDAPGVANFKLWTGADEVEWLGEWEWSSSRMLRRAVNARVSNRPAAALP